MNYIDLRSDTVTQPTLEMREAMYSTPVGDDTFGDDPTVRNLEALAAHTVGKEAALFLGSGTMANQAAVMTHTVRGDEMIISSGSHIVVHEVGAAAVLSGVMVHAIPCERDMLTPEIIEQALRTEEESYGHTSLICLENALSNGMVMPLEQMQACYAVAQKHGLPLHLDGARLFNGAAALGVSPKEMAACCDSVMICLSKSLCAPMGSLLCGSRDFIERARRNRKLLGGDMRQSGLIAACGIIALEKMSRRLEEDHRNARRLGELISQIPGAEVDFARLQINLVFFKLDRPRELVDRLPALMLEKGVKINGLEGGTIRLATHNDITAEDIEYVGATLQELLR